MEEAAASKKIAEEDAINDAAANNATRELLPEETADTETAEINTTNDAAVADIEDYANNTAEDKAPQAPSGDYIEAETTSDDDIKTEATGYDDIKAEATSDEDIKTEATTDDDTKAEATSDDDIKAEATIDDDIKAEATSDDEHIKARNREEAPAKSPPPEKPVHCTQGKHVPGCNTPPYGCPTPDLHHIPGPIPSLYNGLIQHAGHPLTQLCPQPNSRVHVQGAAIQKQEVCPDDTLVRARCLAQQPPQGGRRVYTPQHGGPRPLHASHHADPQHEVRGHQAGGKSL